MNNLINIFFNELSTACRNRSLVRLVLSRPLITGQARRVTARIVETDQGYRLSIVHEQQPSHRTETLPLTEAIAALRKLTGPVYHDAHLFTTGFNLQLRFSRKGKPHLTRKTTGTQKQPDTRHDRAKQYLIPPHSPFLAALDIATANGQIRASMQAKYRQICHFAELARKALDEIEPRNGNFLQVTDLGCGKGYLTFAMHMLLNEILEQPARTTGIDRRQDIVDTANRAANDCDTEGLRFKCGEIRPQSANKSDVVIALHACDTASDDAISAGIKAGAAVIMVAPCCHHALREKITPHGSVAGMLQHRILLERTAALADDALRCLRLECNGYRVQAVEFIDPEHTPRNTLIIARHIGDNPRCNQAQKETQELKNLFGIDAHTP